MDTNRKIRVAISHGDFNGIGYEIILKTLSQQGILELFTPIVYGSAKAAAYYRKSLELDIAPWQQIADAREAVDGQVNLIDLFADDLLVEKGVCSEQAGIAAAKALEAATEAVMRGDADLLVTAPINKAAMPHASWPYTGHTDYLEAKAVEPNEQALMILTKGTCRVALATTHIPISEVSKSLSIELIAQKIEALQRALIKDYAIVCPRIAVLALNPHASDQGLMGNEEETIIKPAIAKAEEAGVVVYGPYAADGFWGSSTPQHFDGILAMYHDQGLAPFKALFMDAGVNVTAGLSIVRTSPDHGTGFDIAGKGVASEESFRQAIYEAIDIYRNRARHAEATRNPLRKLYYERGNDNEKLNLTEPEED